MTQFPRVNASDDLDVFEEVGRGGFGVVYRGIIKSTQQEVAIKQIDLEKIPQIYLKLIRRFKSYLNVDVNKLLAMLAHLLRIINYGSLWNLLMVDQYLNY